MFTGACKKKTTGNGLAAGCKLFYRKIYTVKISVDFYGKKTGNQLPVRFLLFFTGVRKNFQESGTAR